MDLRSILAGFFDNPHHTDIVFDYAGFQVYCSSIVLAHTNPELLDYCKSKGFVAMDKTQPLAAFPAAAQPNPLAPGLHILSVRTHFKIFLTTLKISATELETLLAYCHGAIDTSDFSPVQSIPHVCLALREMGLKRLLLKYYEAQSKTCHFDTYAYFDPADEFYPDRASIFSTRAHLPAKFDEYLWTMDPADVVLVLESNVPVPYNEEKLALRLCEYIRANSSFDIDTKKKLINCLRAPVLNNEFMVQKMDGLLCNDDVLLSHLYRQKIKSGVSRRQDVYFVGDATKKYDGFKLSDVDYSTVEYSTVTIKNHVHAQSLKYGFPSLDGFVPDQMGLPIGKLYTNTKNIKNSGASIHMDITDKSFNQERISDVKNMKIGGFFVSA